MEQDIETRIARGIEFLDSAIKDWRQRIDLNFLDLADPEYCVLGQVFRNEQRACGAYTAGTWRLHDWVEETTGEEADFFAADYGFEREDSDDQYEALTEAWREVLSK
jgi:hypothetical protein